MNVVDIVKRLRERIAIEIKYQQGEGCADLLEEAAMALERAENDAAYAESHRLHLARLLQEITSGAGGGGMSAYTGASKPCLGDLVRCRDGRLGWVAGIATTKMGFVLIDFDEDNLWRMRAPDPDKREEIATENLKLLGRRGWVAANRAALEAPPKSTPAPSD